MGRKNNRTFNKHASIRTRTTFNGKLRTETSRRDDTFNVAVSTVPRDNSSVMYIDVDGGTLILDGRSMRTVLRVLTNHFAALGKDLPEESYYR